MTRQQKTVAKMIELKEFNTEQLEVEVRHARMRLTNEENNLAELVGRYDHTSDDFSRKHGSDGLPVQEVDLFYTYLKHLAILIEKQKGIVAVRSAEFEDKQQAMMAAYREQRLLEILQDKMQQERTRQSVKGEQKEADYQFLTRKQQA